MPTTIYLLGRVSTQRELAPLKFMGGDEIPASTETVEPFFETHGIESVVLADDDRLIADEGGLTVRSGPMPDKADIDSVFVPYRRTTFYPWWRIIETVTTREEA